jgi:fatty acid desaturase
LCLYALAVYIIITKEHNLINILSAAYIHGCGNQQIAFLLHDTSHNAVFKERKNNHVVSSIIANIIGGISVGMWKDEH